jgi:hypothetical protein
VSHYARQHFLLCGPCCFLSTTCQTTPSYLNYLKGFALTLLLAAAAAAAAVLRRRRTSNVVWIAGISAEPENYFDTMATLRLGQRLRETHRFTTASIGLCAKFFVAWRNVLSARLRAMDEPTNWQSMGPGSASGLGSIAMIAEALRRPNVNFETTLSSHRR